MMILDRGWAGDWDYTPSLLDSAAARLEDLYRAAGRATSSQQDAGAEIRRVLSEDLDVPAALNLAIEAGGGPARTVATALGFS